MDCSKKKEKVNVLLERTDVALHHKNPFLGRGFVIMIGADGRPPLPDNGRPPLPDDNRPPLRKKGLCLDLVDKS
jgi:hypothetical protein